MYNRVLNFCSFLSDIQYKLDEDTTQSKSPIHPAIVDKTPTSPESLQLLMSSDLNKYLAFQTPPIQTQPPIVLKTPRFVPITPVVSATKVKDEKLQDLIPTVMLSVLPPVSVVTPPVVPPVSIPITGRPPVSVVNPIPAPITGRPSVSVVNPIPTPITGRPSVSVVNPIPTPIRALLENI